MTTERQRETARSNIRKAQRTWQQMSPRQRSRAQSAGRQRAKPGTKGGGDYYHVVVRPKRQFTSFRVHDVGRGGHTKRVAGRRKSGSWDTQKWLIRKWDARVENGWLHATDDRVGKVLAQLGTTPRHVRGDIFSARPRPNVPERAKPMPAQQRAREENITRAQAARENRGGARREVHT